MTKFKVGDRVGRSAEMKTTKLNEGDVASVGVVRTITNEGKYIVKWDAQWQNNNPPEPFSESKLVAEEEYMAFYSKLEQEYNAVVAEIRGKLSIAAKMLRESNDIADKYGEQLSYMGEALSDLHSAMSDIGWNTSSLNC